MKPSTIKALLNSDLTRYNTASNLLITAIADQLKVLKIEYTFQSEEYGDISLKLDHPFVTKITMLSTRIDLHHCDNSTDSPAFFIDDRYWKATLKRFLTEDFKGCFF